MSSYQEGIIIGLILASGFWATIYALLDFLNSNKRKPPDRQDK